MQVDVARVTFRLIDLFEIGYAPCSLYERKDSFLEYLIILTFAIRGVIFATFETWSIYILPEKSSNISHIS